MSSGKKGVYLTLAVGVLNLAPPILIKTDSATTLAGVVKPFKQDLVNVFNIFLKTQDEIWAGLDGTERVMEHIRHSVSVISVTRAARAGLPVSQVLPHGSWHGKFYLVPVLGSNPRQRMFPQRA